MTMSARAAIDRLEAVRLQIQSLLDSEKTQAERNRLGQFATPSALAVEILEYAAESLSTSVPVRFLDPAFGTGSFYSALLRVFPAGRVAAASAYEIDPHYGLRAAELWNGSALDLRVTDFTRAAPPSDEGARYDLLICNPPYVRHHHLSEDDKLRLRAMVERAAGIRLSGLAGLYCYFMCLSPAWLVGGGLAGWLLPSEFMDVNYGQQVKEFLLNRVTLSRVHRFDPGDVQFDDALVSSAVVWFKNSPPPPDHTVEFSYGGTLLEPALTARIHAKSLLRAPKWTRFPSEGVCIPAGEGAVRLSDLFTIKRGLATGANNFFVVTSETAREHDLPAEFLTSILPGPRYIQTDEVRADEAGEPDVGRKLYLLSCDLPEAQVKEFYPSLWRYLQKGVREGVRERYLCRNRRPWYSQERRPPPPLLCTYMGRKDNARGRPFRFILNTSNATAANVYLMLYPKPAFQTALRADPGLLRSLWLHLNQMSPAALAGEGRVYGGGLHKMEPKELGNVRIAESIISPSIPFPLLSRDCCL